MRTSVMPVRGLLARGVATCYRLDCWHALSGRRVRPTRCAPAGLYTGTALGQDGSNRSRDLATLTFDLGGHGACG